MKPLLFTIAAAALSGCASYQLPPIAADKFEYRRTDPLGGSTITAIGVRVDGEKVKADRVTWATKYPSFNVEVIVENYERTR